MEISIIYILYSLRLVTLACGIKNIKINFAIRPRTNFSKPFDIIELNMIGAGIKSMNLQIMAGNYTAAVGEIATMEI